MGTPGEEWIRNRNGQHRFGLGTAEALERWGLASETSRERRTRGQQGDPRSQRQVGSGALRPGEEPPREQRRSVTQPYEVGFGRSPNQRTPPRNERPSDRGRHPPGGGSSGSSEAHDEAVEDRIVDRGGDPVMLDHGLETGHASLQDALPVRGTHRDGKGDADPHHIRHPRARRMTGTRNSRSWTMRAGEGERQQLQPSFYKSYVT
jgi:hypothetical protein